MTDWSYDPQAHTEIFLPKYSGFIPHKIDLEKKKYTECKDRNINQRVFVTLNSAKLDTIINIPQNDDYVMQKVP